MGKNQIQSIQDETISFIDIYYLVQIDKYNSDGKTIIPTEYIKFNADDLIPIDKRKQAIAFINKTLASYPDKSIEDNQKLNIKLIYFPAQNKRERIILDASLDINGLNVEESTLNRSQVMDNLVIENNDYTEFSLEKKDSFRMRDISNLEGILWIKLNTTKKTAIL